MKKNLLETARHIAIEGPIGVGKTSLARRLAEHLGADTLLEQPEANPFLPHFYQDRKHFALQTQLWFLFQRLDQMQALTQRDAAARPVVCDFLIEKDPLFAGATLSEDEYKLYRRVHERVAPPSPVVPDLVIYLQARPEALVARVRKRGIEMERKISDDYLILLGDGYTKFFHDYEAAPVMVVNSENLDFAGKESDFQLLVQRIEAMRGHHEYFNMGE